MGFSLIASAAILGVTLFLAVEIITGDLLPTIEGINSSYGDMNNRLKDQLQTDINITAASRTVSGTNFSYNISVKNTGSVTLNTEDFKILINGTEYQSTCNRLYVHPENTVFFQVENVTDAGGERIKVITNNGIADYFTLGS
jgi:archaellum component FlaF (FlaF/FlaG flagellin family)